MTVLSIVMPVHNAGAQLDRTLQRLDGVLSANRGLVEVIVVDDHSTDGSSETLSLWAGEHSGVTLVMASTRGVANARNMAIESSVGEYLWFVDADDEWPTDALTTILDQLSDDAADVICFGALRLDDRGAVLRHIDEFRQPRTVSGQELLLLLLEGQVEGHLWNKVFRKSALATNPFPEIRSHSDLGGMLGLATRAGVVRLHPAVIYSYVERSDSILTSAHYDPSTLEACLEIAEAQVGAAPTPESRAALDVFSYARVILPQAHHAIGRGDALKRTTLHPSAVVTGATPSTYRHLFRWKPSLALQAILLKASPRLYSLVYQMGVRMRRKYRPDLRQEDHVFLVVQSFVATYRKPFFDALSAWLQAHHASLAVWHDMPRGAVAARGNATTGDWSLLRRQLRLTFRGRSVTFRPRLLVSTRPYRRVVSPLASTNLETYLLALDPRVSLVLWGQGKAYTSKRLALDERLELWLCRRAEHLLLYTPGGAAHLVGRGISPDKITVLYNSTDTKALRAHVASTSVQDSDRFRQEHGLKAGDRVACFVGAFHASKRLDFLVRAADEVVLKEPSFKLIIAGAGPLEAEINALATTRPHVRVLGRQEGEQLAALASVSSLMLIPGRIGLAAVDSLVLGLPVVSTNFDFHAPEAEYLDESTSIITAPDLNSYARGILDVLRDPERLASMSHNCTVRSAEFSVELMAARFGRALIGA